MDLSHIIAFNIALGFTLISPGPAMLCSIQTTLNAGRLAGIWVGLGLSAVGTIWLWTAYFGVDLIFNSHPWAYVIVKFLGAGYLIFIAVKMWINADQEIEPSSIVQNQFFIRGALINLLNPKAVLFASAVIVTIFPSNLSIAEMTFISANQFILELLTYSIFAVFFSKPQISHSYNQLKSKIDKAASIVLGTLAGRILVNP